MSRRSRRTPTLTQWRRRRRRRATRIAAATLLALTALAVAARSTDVAWTSDPFDRYHERTFAVLRVVDGDTLDLAVPDGSRRYTRVRLWGVDAPERAREDRPAEPWALTATRWLADRVEDRRVTLRLEPQRLRDAYGRLLAHVRLDGSDPLNAALLARGLARFDGRWSHSLLRSYQRAERRARDRGVGLWSDREMP